MVPLCLEPGSISEFLPLLIPGIIAALESSVIGAAIVKRWNWILFVTFALLSGCGNKGALYMPDQPDPAAPVPQTSAQPPAPAQN
ncbi:LPS translocon maturation chaperone LptM [Marinobacterium rhizophilum]|uniref:LPS translocon maturation chaperone LptM n=1 Tax=Marinobacterium rhizophilum TaxID=420402 RepID=UPI003B84B2E7